MTEPQGIPIVPVVTVQPIASPPLKPGWKSTETWLAFLSAMLGAAVTSGLIADGSATQRVAGMALTFLSMAFHMWSRTTLKVNQ